MRLEISPPTAPAKPQRMTSVSSADPPARRQRMGICLGAEYVACAADRMEETRLIAGFQLPSKVRYEDLDGVRRCERIVAPYLLEEPLSRHDDALVAHEVFEQLELALGEIDLATLAPDLVRVRVELQVADDEPRTSARRPAAQQRAQAREQLLALERLDEVVVGAGVEALDARLDRVARGEHEDRHIVGRAQAPRDLDAVDLRQAEIEDHEVGMVGGGLVERCLPVARDPHVVAVQAQRALQDLGDLVVVLDDEHAGITTDTVHCGQRVRRAMNAK